jgi:outer membrane biosynthesis protein TonB
VKPGEYGVTAFEKHGSKQGTGPLARPGAGQRLLVLALVAALNLLVVFLLLAALRPPPPLPPETRAVELALRTDRPPPPPPPPVPAAVRPQQMEKAAPRIEIETPPAVTAPPQGTPGRGAAGNAGANADTVIARAPAPIPPVAADPNCESMDAYLTRIRAAILRFFDYPAAAREAGIQGEVLMRFYASPAGRILDSTLATSFVERVYRSREENGRYHDLLLGFTRTGPDSWAWQARVHSNAGPDIMMGRGTVRAGEDGILRAPERPDGMLVLEIPDNIPAGVARVSLRFGRTNELLLLEKAVERTLRLAQPLPAIPVCLKLSMLNASMPFTYRLERR